MRVLSVYALRSAADQPGARGAVRVLPLKSALRRASYGGHPKVFPAPVSCRGGRHVRPEPDLDSLAGGVMDRATRHRVVVVGGGFGGLQAALALRHGPVDVTLVDRRNFHLFQPLTYQVATGALSPGEVAYPLRAIFKRSPNVRVIQAEVTGFDLNAREVQLRSVDGLPAPEPVR